MVFINFGDSDKPEWQWSCHQQRNWRQFQLFATPHLNCHVTKVPWHHLDHPKIIESDISNIILRNVVFQPIIIQWVASSWRSSSLYCPKRNSVEMTIGKMYPTLINRARVLAMYLSVFIGIFWQSYNRNWSEFISNHNCRII